jgi:hypothetical protein
LSIELKKRYLWLEIALPENTPTYIPRGFSNFATETAWKLRTQTRKDKERGLFEMSFLLPVSNNLSGAFLHGTGACFSLR